MRRRISGTNALPLTLALQGLAFVLIGFFVASERAPTEREPAAGGGELAQAGESGSIPFQLPRDLEPERLPVPRLPDWDEPQSPPAPKPEKEGPPAPAVKEPKLAGLRVQGVALASLTPTRASAQLPDAPDSLEGLPITGSGRSWLGGTRRVSNGSGGYAGPSDVGDGNGGWGGSGIGGSGTGSGGYCPTPGRIGRPVRGGGGRGSGGGGDGGGTTAGPTGVSGPQGAPAGTGGRGGGGEGRGKGGGRPKGKGRSK